MFPQPASALFEPQISPLDSYLFWCYMCSVQLVLQACGKTYNLLNNLRRVEHSAVVQIWLQSALYLCIRFFQFLGNLVSDFVRMAIPWLIFFLCVSSLTGPPPRTGHSAPWIQSSCCILRLCPGPTLLRWPRNIPSWGPVSPVDPNWAAWEFPLPRRESPDHPARARSTPWLTTSLLRVMVEEEEERVE